MGRRKAAIYERIDTEAVAADAAYGQCDERRWSAEDQVTAAEAALALVQAESVDASISGKPFLTSRDARTKLEDAIDQLEAIKLSEPRLRKQVEEAAGEVANAQYKIRETIRAIIAASPGVARIAAEAEAAQKTLCRNIQIVHAMGAKRVWPDALLYAAVWRDVPTACLAALRMAWLS